MFIRNIFKILLFLIALYKKTVSWVLLEILEYLIKNTLNINKMKVVFVKICLFYECLFSKYIFFIKT
jgi:hypothetical protein